MEEMPPAPAGFIVRSGQKDQISSRGEGILWTRAKAAVETCSCTRWFCSRRVRAKPARLSSAWPWLRSLHLSACSIYRTEQPALLSIPPVSSNLNLHTYTETVIKLLSE